MCTFLLEIGVYTHAYTNISIFSWRWGWFKLQFSKTKFGCKSSLKLEDQPLQWAKCLQSKMHIFYSCLLSKLVVSKKITAKKYKFIKLKQKKMIKILHSKHGLQSKMQIKMQHIWNLIKCNVICVYVYNSIFLFSKWQPIQFQKKIFFMP